MTDKPHRRNLNSVQIEDHEADDAHREIAIDVLTYLALDPDTCHLYNDVTEADLWRINERWAGYLARIGMWALPYVSVERQRHKCSLRMDPNADLNNLLLPPAHSYHCCSISVPDSVLRPSVGDPAPGLWIAVPNKRVTHWRKSITFWLKQLADEQHSGWQMHNVAAGVTNLAERREAR